MALEYTGDYCARCGAAQLEGRRGESCNALVKGKRCGNLSYTPSVDLINWASLNDKDWKMLQEFRISRDGVKTR